MKILSICIPSSRDLKTLYNLLDSIEVISLSLGFRDFIEVCVFFNGNNPMSVTSSKIDKFSNSIIKLDIDLSMQQSINLATGQYIWMLGDDDKDKVCTLPKIMNRIKLDDPDVILIHSSNSSNSRLNEQSQIITPRMFIKKYWDKLSFGSFISRTVFIQNNGFFNQFLNSKHAYAGVLLSSVAKLDDLNVSTLLYVQSEDIYQKTYQSEHTLVHLLDIPYFFSVLEKFYPSEMIYIFQLYHDRHFKFRFMLKWVSNLDIKIIYNDRLDLNIRIKLFFVILIKKFILTTRVVFSKFPRELFHRL
jgi:hypothetical protein